MKKYLNFNKKMFEKVVTFLRFLFDEELHYSPPPTPPPSTTKMEYAINEAGEEILIEYIHILSNKYLA
jgi:hypothetical protein